MSYQVDIYCPEKVVETSIPATEVFVPTVRGEMNILPEHTHMITELAHGTLCIVNKSEKTYYAINSGVLKILENKITILAGTAERADQIDVERAQKAYKKAQDYLNSGAMEDDAERQEMEKKRYRAQTRLRVAEIKLKKNFLN